MSDPFELRGGNYIELLRGPVADPAISMLLRKEHLAVLKVRQLEMQIQQVEQHIEMLKMQRDLLAEEYDIK
jgi:transcription initiation factor IIF auxiliary subunit